MPFLDHRGPLAEPPGAAHSFHDVAIVLPAVDRPHVSFPLHVWCRGGLLPIHSSSDIHARAEDLVRTHVLVLLTATLLFGATAAAQSGRGAAPPCDRDCLTAMAEQYLEALVAKDPGRVPFEPDAKYTENGQ